MADSSKENAPQPNGSFFIRDDGAVVITLDPPEKNRASDPIDVRLLLNPGDIFGGVPYARFIQRSGGLLHIDPRRGTVTILNKRQQAEPG